MATIQIFFDFILHVDKYLDVIIQNYGAAAYIILFLIIFCETGLVIAPFFPGDSLLFIAGAFAARGTMNEFLLFLILSLAAIIGDSFNYMVGNYTGEKLISNNKLIKKEHIDKTKAFYEKHGGKTIILARFIPIIRTFAPFVAGIGAMEYKRFLSYNVVGGITWVAIFIFSGYYFGKIPFVQENLTYVILLIIFLSILPVIITFIKNKIKNKRVKNSI